MNKFLAFAAALLVLTACSPPQGGAPPSSTAAATPAPPAPPGAQVVSMEVTEDGYAPADVHVAAGRPVRLRITRKTDANCAKEIQSPEAGIPLTPLPLGQEVIVDFTPARAGDMKFGCGMNMMIAGTFHAGGVPAAPSGSPSP